MIYIANKLHTFYLNIRIKNLSLTIVKSFLKFLSTLTFKDEKQNFAFLLAHKLRKDTFYTSA